jgi:hypothetical protein
MLAGYLGMKSNEKAVEPEPVQNLFDLPGVVFTRTPKPKDG